MIQSKVKAGERTTKKEEKPMSMSSSENGCSATITQLLSYFSTMDFTATPTRITLTKDVHAIRNVVFGYVATSWNERRTTDTNSSSDSGTGIRELELSLPTTDSDYSLINELLTALIQRLIPALSSLFNQSTLRYSTIIVS